MLNDDVLNPSYSLASLVDQAGFRFLPVAGSPLRALYDLTGRNQEVLGNTVDESANDSAPYADILKARSVAKNAAGVEEHTVAMAEASAVVFRSVSNQINFARNRVNPLISKVHEDTLEKTKSLENAGVYRYTVVPYYYHELWDNSGWLGVVSKYSNLPLEALPLSVRWPDLSGEELLEALKSGVKAFDDAVNTIIADLPQETLGELYKAVFQQDNDLQAKYKLFVGGNDSFSFSNERSNLNHVILLHLMAKGFDKKTVAVEGLTGQAYNTAISIIIGQSGRRLAIANEFRNADVKRKVLVYSFPIGTPFATSVEYSAIQVNGDLYNKYLEAGGSPEALIGNAQGPLLMEFDEILAAGPKLLSIYRTNERLLTEQLEANYFGRVRSELRNALFAVLNEIPDEELSRSREECVKELTEHLGYLTDADLKDLWVNVRHIVCHVFFKHSDALRILKHYDEAAKKHQDLDSKELAMHTLTEYLLDYVVETIGVDKNAG